MIEITKHCWNLSKVVKVVAGEDCYRQVYEYLNIAAGIEKIKIDLHRYDTSFGWCNDRDHYRFSEEELLEKYISRLTTFTYVWGALEALVDEVKLKPSPKRGKINDICYFLKENLHPSDTVPSYEAHLEKLFTLSKDSDVDGKEILNRFNGHKYISIHGLGIYVVYKIRNSFAHGALVFPEPEPCEHKPISSYPELVAVSTRITLLTMQMILLIELRDKGICKDEYFELFDEQNIPIENTLRTLHSKKETNNEKQLKLC